MSFIHQLSSRLARLRPAFLRARETESDESDLDPAEEFQKIQRGLRRLSLASDRSGEILQAVSARLDELQQTFLNLNRPRQVALALEEAELLRILDQLDRAASVPELPPAAHSFVDGAKTALLAGAGWQAIALNGAKPEGADIRVAEFLGVAGANGQAASVHIHRVLEQGYRRADGTLLRPGVVIAAADSNGDPS